jgi:hypothetical protein
LSDEHHSFLSVVIKKCKDKPYCHSDENKIREFINSLKVTTFTFQSRIDFVNRDSFPTSDEFRDMGKQFLKFNEIYIMSAVLEHNSVETFDSKIKSFSPT